MIADWEIGGGLARLWLGDCLQRLRGLDDCAVDAVVTDPPYGLSFMGRRWDAEVPSVDVWREVLRVLKPGGHLLCFAGTRTHHRMACAIEDAGFEIRDMLAWVYGSGFPKSLDVSKAIDKASGAERSKVRTPMGPTGDKYAKGLGDSRPWMAKAAEVGYHEHDSDVPASDVARDWQGWGTALKPALEPITLARKPLAGTVAENVLRHGTGALNVDGCRVGNTVETWPKSRSYGTKSKKFDTYEEQQAETQETGATPPGRWPANLIHDGGEEVSGLLGDAARFFYCPKAGKLDREEGCEGLEERRGNSLNIRTDRHSQANGMDTGPRRNHHPTVKPTDLMRYLCRLVTPPGGLVLDPFTGSGSTGKAALLEGFRFIGIELNPDYLRIARDRIAWAFYQAGQNLFSSVEIAHGE